MQTDTKAIRFPCSACGGPMSFDAESQQMKCHYCGSEQTIENAIAEPQEHPLAFGEEPEDLHDWGTDQQAIHCETCGGETLIPALQTTATCVFCGSVKVLPMNDVKSIRPETIIPFQVSKEHALGFFASWKRKKWFLPNEFKKQNVASQLNAIYIPYWTYDTDTYSLYTAERGVYHYRTVTRTRVVNGKTQTYTEQERYTVWTRTSGEYDRFFDDLLIPASGHYNGKLLNELGNFDLRHLLPYKPEYVSGHIAERYSIDREQGWGLAQQRADMMLANEITRRIGGDEVRNLNVRTEYSGQTYKHMLLPVWDASYTYRTKPYYYMVNGQTGKIAGHVPRSPWKITLFTLACLVVAAFLIYYFALTDGTVTPY